LSDEKTNDLHQIERDLIEAISLAQKHGLAATEARARDALAEVRRLLAESD